MTNYHTFKIKNNFAELELLCVEINEIAQIGRFAEQLIFCLNLCLEEMLTNIIKYAYNDNDVHEIKVRLDIANEIITLTIIDDGHEFNPLKAEVPDISSDIKHREIGGIGILLTRKMADKIIYTRKDNENILKIILTPYIFII